jgi:hypothetical protein
VTFKDHFSGHAGLYTQFRPRYPLALFEYLASLPAGRRRAWDCGTGNGQAAVDLARWFDQVIATDPSAEQIAHARPVDNVEYRVAAAEDCPLADDSVDLIAVAQALHWFDLGRFYAEARRVGRDGSVLAAWSYGLAKIASPIDSIVWHLYSDVLDLYWPAERKLVEAGYATMDFPFDELAAPAFSMTAEWRLRDMIGYLGTWSAVRRYIESHHTDPVAAIEPDLARAWEDADQPRQVIWPLFLRLGRIRPAG